MSRRLTRKQKEAVADMRWTDDPSLGGIGEQCRFCGGAHPGVLCHKIKSVEFHVDGTIKKINLKGGRGPSEVDNEQSR